MDAGVRDRRGCVTDTGGSLAHTAIISREYGIPCVVGTAVATSTIRTGDRVRVDGDRGVVEVLGVTGDADLAQWAETAERAARAAGAVLIGCAALREVTLKDVRVDVTSSADLAAQGAVTAAIRAEHPDHVVVGEELDGEQEKRRSRRTVWSGSSTRSTAPATTSTASRASARRWR